MEWIEAKTLVTKNKSNAWFGTDYNMNIYRGCCHGCIYCDSRSACYGTEDFDRVRAKARALEIIRDDLRRKSRKGVVATGAMSDPYNPLEAEHQLTRHALELLYAYGFGAAVCTKSDLVARDLDVLEDIQRAAPVLVKFTVTTADEALAAKVEPGAPPPVRRFAALEKLAEAGIKTGVLLMPVLPFLEDSEKNVTDVVNRAADKGARFVYAYFGVTLRENQREWYYAALERIAPGLKERYAARYGERYSCLSPKASRLKEAFEAACERRGLLWTMPAIIQDYQLPYRTDQMTLFE